MFQNKLTGAAANTAQKNLQDYQEQLEGDFKKLSSRGEKLKNIK